MEQPTLASKHCKPCEAGVPPLNTEKIEALLKQTPSWETNADKSKITRKLSFKNFLRTMAFVNAIAYLANEEGHHPDLHIGYNYCHIEYTTHAINGLSENDFICAQKINALIS